MIIHCSFIKPGVRFSAPVFFEDGKNMFLGANCPAKAFHLSALKRWNIPFLVTEGHILPEDSVEENDVEELEPLDDDEDVAELEEI
ncbi:phosphohydrolase [Treponema sp.]|uniref:phosphohydrolase n=1 Tax=Treponema sp. TaxID=166 RepID=UPI00298D848A|nr:phosphohydrolase [Treponema sp.]MCQ2240278.1 phosphohydrolase [Treponema sp.]